MGVRACVCEYACGRHVLPKILLIRMTRPSVRSGSCKVNMAHDHGGHFENKNGRIKHKILIAIIQICYMGIRTWTGNDNLVWLMDYTCVCVSIISDSYTQLNIWIEIFQ